MKHFYIIANPLKEGTEEMADRLTSYLTEKGAECVWYQQVIEDDGTEVPLPPPPEDTECVITLGGDGTLISAARRLKDRRIPLLGINMGRLGYLTQIASKDALFPMIDELLADHYDLEYRMMLEGRVFDEDAGFGGPLADETALNDIVLTRKGSLSAIHFEVSVNGHYVNEYTADGMLVATPTGSTAYNFSAGGPVVKPGARIMVMTPICSHSLNSRSIVLTASDSVRIHPLAKSGGTERMVVFDGGEEIAIDETKVVEITAAKQEAAFVRLKNGSFESSLRKKLRRL